MISYDNKLNQANTRIDDTERNVFYFLAKDDLEGNYSIFEFGYNYFKRIMDNTCNVTYAHYWQSKGLSNEKIDAANTNTDNDLAPIVKFNGSQMYLEFKGAILKENKATYSHGSVANIYIVYKLKPYVNANTGLTINDCLFGAIKLTKNSDPVKYKYEGYGICFDSIWTYSFGNEYPKNVIIFGANLKNSVHAINRANNELILGKGIVQKINNITLYAEQISKTNCTVTNKTFELSLHYNRDNSYFFVNGVQQVKFKSADSEINPYNSCLVNISKVFSSVNA